MVSMPSECGMFRPNFIVFLFQIFFLTAVDSWSPTNSYSPGFIHAPANIDYIRYGNGLSKEEERWLSKRDSISQPELKKFLKRTELDFDYEPLLRKGSVRIAHAFSGGGFRAMLHGAGSFTALDSRTTGSKLPGHVGGLLDSATYISGLSGGSWLLASIYVNNFTTVQKLVKSPKFWTVENNLVFARNPIPYWTTLITQTNQKAFAGFQTSLTDIWSRAIALKVFGLPDGKPPIQWSDMQNWDWFKAAQAPFPIVVADGREPGTIIISENSTLFEITPFELGSYDSSLFAFVDLKYLGTEFMNGTPTNYSEIVTGFDNAAFIAGTSSSIFNELIIMLSQTKRFIAKLILSLIRGPFTLYNTDIAVYRPNPFYLLQNLAIPLGRRPSKIPSQEVLALVDGGEDGQNIPIQPFLHPKRKVDVIFAFDNSADTGYNWPNGSSLEKTFWRNLLYSTTNRPTLFPLVPSPDIFIDEKLTKRPVFLGCDDNQYLRGLNTRTKSPVIVYLPNYSYSHLTNISTFKMDYSKQEVLNMINNGYNLATQMNGTRDAYWTTCVACAILKRSMERHQIESETCNDCFREYCWNRSLTDTHEGYMDEAKPYHVLDSVQNWKNPKQDLHHNHGSQILPGWNLNKEQP